MFGFLKKKLKEGIDKLTKSVKPEEDVSVEDIQEAVDEVKKEEIQEQPQEEKISEEPKEVKEEPISDESSKEEKVEEKPQEKEVQEESEASLEPEIPEEPEVTKEEPKKVEPKVEVKEEPKHEPKVEKPKEVKKPEKKIGFLQKVQKAITEKTITEDQVKDVLQEMEISLVESDVALEVSEKIISNLRKDLVGKSVKRSDDIEKIIRESLEKSIKEITDVPKINLEDKIKSNKPALLLFLGFNGSGKTTSIARVADLLNKKGYSCIMAAADTWRAASIEQLEEHGKNLGIKVIKQKYGSDPAAVIFDAVKHAKSNDIDVVLADTAGRSHANVNLVEELKKIVRVNNPHVKILVIDALTGNDVVDQAKVFDEATGIDGLIITKTDVYDKGGAILSAVHSTKKPIMFLGTGQEYIDLEEFTIDKFIERLLS